MLLDDAAAGRFPPADGLVDVVPSPGGPADAIIGLTGHFMLTADIAADEVAERLPDGDFRADVVGDVAVDRTSTRLEAGATRYRREMRRFVADDDAAVVVIGRDLCDRWEFGYEVESWAQGRGLGRKIAAAGLLPAGEPLWGQVAPGNATSLRALAAADFVPVGAEVLFPKAVGQVPL